MSRGASGVEGAVITSDEAWTGRWAGPSAFRVVDGRLRRTGPRSSATAGVAAHVRGALLPGMVDHHVHLDLTDPGALAPGGLARVLDLGGEPRAAARWRALGDGALTGHDLGTDLDGDDVRPACDVEVEFTGALLTAAGARPADGPSAGRETVRELATARDAVDAVAEMLWFGATLVQVALDAGDGAGPALADELLAVVVDEAHAAGVPVVALARGPGQVARAVAAGADLLAGAPWTERLPEEALRAAADRCTWISALDVHRRQGRPEDHELALDNLARFAAAGGRVRYGTCLGSSGPAPGVDERELLALVDCGLDAAQLLDAIAPVHHADAGPHGAGPDLGARVTWMPSPVPDARTDPRELAARLTRAAAIAVTDLEETFA